MKKILCMCMAWLHGGIEAYLLNVFDHIDREQYAFDVALPGMFKWEYEEALEQRGIHVIHYPADSIGQQVKEVRRILNAGDYDVVHVMQSYVAVDTYSIFALVAIAERKHHRYKVICHSHATEDKTKTPAFSKKIVREVFRNSLRWGFFPCRPSGRLFPGGGRIPIRK